jgi:subtilisin family serine protease
MNKFTTISTKDYTPLSYKEEYFHNKYELIQSFISEKIGEDFSDILAMPVIKERDVEWYTKSERKFKRVSEYPKSEQDKILSIYWGKINKINKLSASFTSSNSFDKKRWAKLVNDVFNSNNNIVFSDGENIVLLWGWKFNALEENYVPPSPIISTADAIEANTISEPIEDDNPIPRIPPTSTNEDPIIPKLPWYIVFWEWIKKIFGRFWWILLLLLILWFLLNLDSCSCNQPKNYVEKDDSYIDRNNPINDENTWPDHNNTGLEDDEYEYIIDNNNSHDLYDNLLIDEDGNRRKLPRIPDVQIPINPDDIIDENIVPDRINIYLKDKDDKTVDFSNDFYAIYPIERYQIIYESPKNRRIQIRVPEDERENIKEKIKENLNQYEILIWDETLFQKNYSSFNDRGFNDIDKRWFFENINMESAWQKTTGEKDIIVAIIDDGFDLNHDEINDNIVDAWNIINQNSNVYSSNTLSHGTHVSGIAISEKNNNFGVCGIAPDCSFMPIQIGAEGSRYLSSTSVIDGILYAINHNADVINLSLAAKYTPHDSIRFHDMSANEYNDYIRNHGKDQEQFWEELFKIADDSNVTIVFAAGNQDVLIGISPENRFKNSVITVSAVDKNNKKASFSNHGKDHSTISAPGVDIYSCVPGNKFDSWPGTSMSAPIITGVVALMKSINPDLTNKEIIKILKETGKEVDPTIGPLVQVDEALSLCKSFNITKDNELNTDSIRNEIEKLENRIIKLEKLLE